MSQLAELAVAASGGVAFERVHGPAHLAQQLLVFGMLLQLQALVVEILQQLRGALKEELAEFGGAVVGKEAHTVTSIRW